jgi:putative FmdB family regulatory protein
MPSYDFNCPTCGHMEERLVSYSERNTQTCLKCQNTLNIAWVKSQAPVIFREDNYQIGVDSRAGTQISSKRQLLDQIKYANDSNPNPVTFASEYYG